MEKNFLVVLDVTGRGLSAPKNIVYEWWSRLRDYYYAFSFRTRLEEVVSDTRAHPGIMLVVGSAFLLSYPRGKDGLKTELAAIGFPPERVVFVLGSIGCLVYECRGEISRDLFLLLTEHTRVVQ